jgi:hypothetical protein
MVAHARRIAPSDGDRRDRLWRSRIGEEPCSRDAAQEREGPSIYRRPAGPRVGRDRATTLGPDAKLGRRERDGDGPVAIGPKDAGAGRGQAFEGRAGRMAVRVPGPRRCDGDARPNRIDECLRRGGAAAVMGDLEQIEPRQLLGQQRRVDRLLDVTREQESVVADRPQEDDRHVVDPRAPIGRLERDLAADRPEDPEVDVVDREPVARGETQAHRRTSRSQPRQPGRVAGSRPAHPGLEDASHLIPIEQPGEAGHVVLVRVREDHAIDAPVPRRDSLVEHDEQAARIWAAIDEEPTAARALDEDRVALSDVEHAHARDTRRAAVQHGAGHRHRDD